jgi:hypothetical protein
VAEIDLPGEKEKIWHRMRDDLKSLSPGFADDDLLLCPMPLATLLRYAPPRLRFRPDFRSMF